MDHGSGSFLRIYCGLHLSEKRIPLKLVHTKGGVIQLHKHNYIYTGVQKEWTMGHFLALSKNLLQSKYSCVFFYIM